MTKKILTITSKSASKILTSCFLIAALFGAALYSGGISKAAGADSLLLSPSSGSYNTGTTFTVSLQENSNSDTIVSADADLLYNTSQLQYVSSSTTGAFNLCIPSVTSGEVNIGCTLTGSPGLTGTQTIGSVTFKTLVGTGKAAITFGSQSNIQNASTTSFWNGATAAGSYTLTTPVTTPPVTTPPVTTPPVTTPPSTGGGTTPTKTSTPTTSTTTKSSGSSTTTTTASTPATGATAVAVPATAAPTASNPAPAISDISISGLTTTSVTISWKTDLASTSVVEYGNSSKYGLTTQNNALVTDHQVVLTTPNLTSATHYQFVVLSVSAAGVGSTSAAGGFTTLGFPVTIRVVDAHGKLIKGAVVTSDGQTRTTNGAGFVTFQNLPSGPQTIVIKAGDKTTKRVIMVSNTIPATGNASLQQFSLSAVRGTTNPVYYLITVVIIVAAAGGALFMPRNRLMHGFPMTPATAGADPDIHGTAGPIVDESSVPIIPTTSMGGVSSVGTHEPGQVIAPSGSEPADPVSSSEDTPTPTSDSATDDDSDDSSPQGPIATPPAS
jgi:hypothetical protein